MNSELKRVLRSLLAPLVMIVAQLLGGVLVVPLTLLGYGNNAIAMALVLIITGIAAVAFCWKVLGIVNLQTSFSTTNINGKIAVYGILAAVCGILATDIVSEIADLPDIIEDTVISMGHNIWGIIALAVAGPIVEELIFREGMMGYMMRSGQVRGWVTVCVSALAFGVIHLNPAQVPFAFIVGLLLGFLYYKTGSIVLCGIVHILNNSMAVLQVNILGERVKDFSLVDSLGGTSYAICIAAVSALLCLILLRIAND